jgi:type IX secretion system PorP/SprF family membrane protein
MNFFRLCALLLYLFAGKAWGQEVRFSQYQSVPVLTNPALAGAEGDYSVDMNYRIQNVGLIAYRTGYFSFTVPLYDQAQEPRHVGGLSIGAVHDMAGETGEIVSTAASLSGAYSIFFDQYGVHSLTFGVQGEFVQTRIDFGELLWPSQVTFDGFDISRPATQLIQGRSDYLRFNAGLLWSYNPAKNLLKGTAGTRMFAGLAFSNLNSPEQSFLQEGSYSLPMLYKLHGGVEIPLKGRMSLVPDFMVMMQNQVYQYTLGTLVNMSRELRSPANPLVTEINIFAGAWYRSSDALVLLIGASHRKFSTAFSYDINTVPNKAGINAQGGVELSLAIRFLKNNKPRKIASPLF